MSVTGIIDYGMGNLHSLGKALERVSGADRIEISYDPAVLLKCDRLVLPGVGGVKGCMDELQRLELNQMVIEASRKMPMLGVCLGMQVMLDFSHENGGIASLKLFPGEVVRFPDPEPDAQPRLKVPHMGWNRVHQTQAHPIWAGIADDSWFYFVHSYHAKPAQPEHVLGSTDYIREFASVIGRDNLVACQFHPEKSQAAGIQLLANFVQWDGTV